ncbi:hypothetical protein [Planococcus lenghuensis]|uniref:Uncharacterized protein n=1 Tax=Planococcus lenghuensis TaxID=2213202 RepID=A0A1Q2L4V1_9BACL|nr:hypothetical protein [Planococcus lenghuensis]AQQ55443.1 hypothetical protein B0X71_19985 [Planococcus lenghuensis]
MRKQQSLEVVEQLCRGGKARGVITWRFPYLTGHDSIKANSKETQNVFHPDIDEVVKIVDVSIDRDTSLLIPNWTKNSITSAGTPLPVCMYTDMN